MILDPVTWAAFADELEKIASGSPFAYKRIMKPKRLFGKIKRMHKKRNFRRVHKKWKYKRPSMGTGGGGGGGGNS